MKKLTTRILITVSILLLGASIIAGERPVQISVKPVFGFMSGYHKFVMDLPVEFEPGLIGSVKSELEYPLDVAVGGLYLAVMPAEHIQDEWGIEIGYLTNVNDPGGKMVDHDWVYIPDQINEKFSYTESPAEMGSTNLFIEGYKSIIRKEKFSIGLIGSLRYQKLSQDIIGYTGWFLDDDGVQVPQSGEGLSLTYEVTYKMPAIGVYTRIRPMPGADITIKTQFAGVWAKDVDDHVLRYRLAEADGDGNAFIGGIRARVKPNGSLNMPGMFFEGDVDFVSSAVKTRGTQRWYGDDPVSPDYDDTGDSWGGIPHNLTSKQLLLSARIGFAF